MNYSKYDKEINRNQFNDLKNTKSYKETYDEINVDTLMNVVKSNQNYFYNEFKKVENGDKTKFNWSAFIFNFGYCYYRKSVDIAKKYYKTFYIATIICMIIFAGIGFIINDKYYMPYLFMALAVFMGMVGLIQLIQAIRCGFNFNKEYYNHCMQLIKYSDVDSDNYGISISKGIIASIIISLILGLSGGILGTGISYATLNLTLSDDYYDNDLTLDKVSPYKIDDSIDLYQYEDVDLDSNYNNNEENKMYNGFTLSEAYQDILVEFWYGYDPEWEIDSNDHTILFTLVDIEKDGKPELFVEAGSCTGDMRLMIYSDVYGVANNIYGEEWGLYINIVELSNHIAIRGYNWSGIWDWEYMYKEGNEIFVSDVVSEDIMESDLVDWYDIEKIF